jgi:hypothetical protein
MGLRELRADWIQLRGNPLKNRATHDEYNRHLPFERQLIGLPEKGQYESFRAVPRPWPLGDKRLAAHIGGRRVPILAGERLTEAARDQVSTAQATILTNTASIKKLTLKLEELKNEKVREEAGPALAAQKKSQADLTDQLAKAHLGIKQARVGLERAALWAEEGKLLTAQNLQAVRAAEEGEVPAEIPGQEKATLPLMGGDWRLKRAWRLPWLQPEGTNAALPESFGGLTLVPKSKRPLVAPAEAPTTIGELLAKHITPLAKSEKDKKVREWWWKTGPLYLPKSEAEQARQFTRADLRANTDYWLQLPENQPRPLYLTNQGVEYIGRPDADVASRRQALAQLYRKIEGIPSAHHTPEQVADALARLEIPLVEQSTGPRGPRGHVTTTRYYNFPSLRLWRLYNQELREYHSHLAKRIVPKAFGGVAFSTGGGVGFRYPEIFNYAQCRLQQQRLIEQQPGWVT